MPVGELGSLAWPSRGVWGAAVLSEARGEDVPLLGHDELWVRHAACASVPVDGEPFFPRPGDDGGAARAVCRACPVVIDCLLYALDNHEEHGIWGGASEVTRRPLARLRREHAGVVPGCRCAFCVAVVEHLRRLDDDLARGRSSRGPVVSFGPGATHGRASTYGRGCRCAECREAKVEQLRRAAERRRGRESVAS